MPVHPDRIGLISVVTPWFDTPTAQNNLDATRKLLEQEYQVSGPTTLVHEGADLEAAIHQFIQEGIGALVLQVGTFPDGQTPARLAESLNIPILVHGLPEPNLTSDIALNSLCGVNLVTYTLTALQKRYLALVGHPTDPALASQMKAYLQAALALGRLRGSRMGLVGFRAPGFYPCSFDELLIRRVLGMSMEYVDLHQIMAATAANQRRPAPTQAFPTIEGGHLSAEAIGWLERHYGALSSVIEQTGYQTVALRDWPELETFDPAVPGGYWPTLGWVQDDGVDLALEGDVNGAVTMALLRQLTGQHSFFADVSAWRESDSALLLWHYGGAPSLAQNPDHILYGENGRHVEFTLKQGHGTLVRLGMHQGQFRLLGISLEMTGERTTLRRAAGWGRTLHTPAQPLVQQLLDEGWEHHFHLVYADLRPQLQAVSRLTGIPLTLL